MIKMPLKCPYAIYGKGFAKSEPVIRCPLAESPDGVGYINEHATQMRRLIPISCTRDIRVLFSRCSVYVTSENVPSDVFICVEVLRSSQPNGVMSSAVSLPNYMFTGQA